MTPAAPNVTTSKATKASNAPADASSQVTGPANEANNGADGPATKVRLKATKDAGAPYPSDASQVNGHVLALPDEDGGFAVVPAPVASTGWTNPVVGREVSEL